MQKQHSNKATFGQISFLHIWYTLKKQKQGSVPSPWILDYQDSCLDDIAKLTVSSITKHSLSYYYDYHIHLTAFFQDNLGKLAQKGKPFWILL